MRAIDFIIWTPVSLLLVFLVLSGYTYLSKASKEFHNYTTPISVQHPQPGYICFLATSNQSVAISCQKE